MDRISRIGNKNDIARCGNRLSQIGQTFLGADGGDNLGVGIEFYAEAAVIIGGLGASQSGNTF